MLYCTYNVSFWNLKLIFVVKKSLIWPIAFLVCSKIYWISFESQMFRNCFLLCICTKYQTILEYCQFSIDFSKSLKVFAISFPYRFLKSRRKSCCEHRFMFFELQYFFGTKILRLIAKLKIYCDVSVFFSYTIFILNEHIELF